MSSDFSIWATMAVDSPSMTSAVASFTRAATNRAWQACPTAHQQPSLLPCSSGSFAKSSLLLRRCLAYLRTARKALLWHALTENGLNRGLFGNRQPPMLHWRPDRHRSFALLARLAASCVLGVSTHRQLSERCNSWSFGTCSWHSKVESLILCLQLVGLLLQ